MHGVGRKSVFENKETYRIQESGKKAKAQRKENPPRKSGGVSLKGDFEPRRTGRGAGPKTKRRVANTEIQIILRHIAQFGFRRRKGGAVGTQHSSPKGGPKDQKEKREKVVRKR